MSNVLNSLRNKIDLVRGTELEKKVKEATSNENWGASSTLKNEIARATYDYEGYKEVMPLIWKRLSEDSKNWRIVFKSLLLLEHLFRLGSERVIQDARDRLFQIRTLQDFNYIDSEGKDHGAGVREKAKQLCELLGDQDRLQEMRENAKQTNNKLHGQSLDGRFGGMGSDSRYDSDDRFARRSYDDWDTRDSRDDQSRRPPAKKPYDFNNSSKDKADDTADAGKSKPKKSSTKKKDSHTEHEKEKEKEKEKKKKKKHESESEPEAEEESEAEAAKRKTKTKEKEKDKKDRSKAKEKPKEASDEEESSPPPKPKHKIKIKLSDSHKSGSPAVKSSKPTRIAAAADDTAFDAAFDEAFPDEASPAPVTKQHQSQRQQPQQQQQQASFANDFEADFSNMQSANDFSTFTSSSPADPFAQDPFGGQDPFQSPAFHQSSPTQRLPPQNMQRMPSQRFQQQQQQQPDPFASSGGFFDVMDQPLPSQAAAQSVPDFDIVSAVSHPKTPSNIKNQQADFTDFTSADNSASANAKSTAKPAASKDQLWDSGLINLTNLSLGPTPAKPSEKKESPGGPFIDLGPSRRNGAMPSFSAQPSRPSNAYGLDSLGGGGNAPLGMAFGGGGSGQFGGAPGAFGGAPAYPPMMMGGMYPGFAPGFGAPVMPGMGFGASPQQMNPFAVGRGRAPPQSGAPW